MEPTRTELRHALRIAIRVGDAEAKRQAEEALKDHQARATDASRGMERGLTLLRDEVLMRKPTKRSGSV